MLARLRRPLLTAIGCAALALAAPLASAYPEGAATASAAPCASSKLVVWLPSSAGSGTAGSVYYRLRVTNLGAACTLRGFPRVSAATLAGRPFGKPATRETNFAAKTVSLAPGGSASFLVRVVEAGNYSASECHPTEAAGFRVELPRGGAKLVPFPFAACAKASAPVLGVGPLQKS